MVIAGSAAPTKEEDIQQTSAAHATQNVQVKPPDKNADALLSARAQQSANGDSDVRLANMDVSKLTITRASTLKPLPELTSLKFGTTMTDHMLIMSFDPSSGWSAPEIRPYGPLTLDPASSCFQYSTNLFEGMKAYLGPDGKPRLFRPEMNMSRMARSASRLALPGIDTTSLLTLIKRLVMLENRWIPSKPGYSLYIRPTLIGTRPSLGVGASTHAMLYIILSPTGPYFPPILTTPRRRNWIPLYASSIYVRAWPGGTGAYKLALNYSPGFAPQLEATKLGYSQILWLLPVDVPGGKEWQITECGQMNFFCALKLDDGGALISQDTLNLHPKRFLGIELLTPSLDGTILPGVTRDSVIALAAGHDKGSPLPGLSNIKLHVRETPIYMSHLVRWEKEGRLLEAFGCGTAAILAGVCRVGWEGRDIVFSNDMEEILRDDEEDINGLGPIGRVFYDRIVAIQQGTVEGHPWSVPCTDAD